MILYDKNYMSKRAAENGFNRDTYEKVLRLMDVLEFLNQDDLLKERLALKGEQPLICWNLTFQDYRLISI